MTLKDKFLNAKTLHASLTIALEDLKLAKKNPKVEIDMGYWYIKNLSGCTVCLAGAVIMRRLKPEETICRPEELGLGQGVTERLRAINMLRTGDIKEAVGHFYNRPAYHKKIKVKPYGERGFWSSMNMVLKFLKENNL